MTLRNLTSWDDPLFRRKSRPVEKFDERLWALLDDMHETLEVAEGSIAPGAPRATVIRPKIVTVSTHDRSETPITVCGSDFLAATLCHEIDHLDGILFTDK